MGKTVISLICLFCGVFAAQGQEYKVASMSIDQMDLTARTNKRIDNNGTACAVLKIFVPDKITKVEGNIIGPIESDGIQKLVYVTAGSKQINLLFENHYPLRIVFDDYNIPTVSERMVYVIKLVEEGLQQASTYNTTVTKPTRSADEILQDAKKAFNDKYYNRAMTLYKSIPENAEAQHEIGYMYDHGIGVTMNKNEALKWYQKSAEQGHPEGQADMGRYYYMGLGGLEKNFENSVYWFRLSAEQECTEGQLLLASAYENGEGVTKSDADALFWYKKAADHGDSQGYYNVGRIYENTNHYLDALKWYKLSSDYDAQRAIERISANVIFTVCDIAPSFPGGESEMFTYLSNQTEYPEMAVQNNIQGRVTVQFVVERDGSIGEVKIVRGKDPDLDQEAIRIVKTIQHMNPGVIQGVNVRCYYYLPINFRIQGL